MLSLEMSRYIYMPASSSRECIIYNIYIVCAIRSHSNDVSDKRMLIYRPHCSTSTERVDEAAAKLKEWSNCDTRDSLMTQRVLAFFFIKSPIVIYIFIFDLCIFEFLLDLCLKKLNHLLTFNIKNCSVLQLTTNAKPCKRKLYFEKGKKLSFYVI